MSKTDIAIEIGVVIITLLIGYQILSSVPKIMNEQMCYACWKMNWKGNITGELSYSCETSFYRNNNQSMKDWCYQNAPLFQDCNDCEPTYPNFWSPFGDLMLVIIFVVIIGIVMAVAYQQEEKKSKKLKVKVE